MKKRMPRPERGRKIERFKARKCYKLEIEKYNVNPMPPDIHKVNKKTKEEIITILNEEELESTQFEPLEGGTYLKINGLTWYLPDIFEDIVDKIRGLLPPKDKGKCHGRFRFIERIKNRINNRIKRLKNRYY